MALPRTAAICSFRLGGTDGVSIEAAKWAWALRELGIAVHTVAGSGTATYLVPGLEIDAIGAPDPDELAAALGDAEVVIVENVCSLPLNRTAAHIVARLLRGRRAVLHHHDLALERPELAHLGPPPDDPSWTHVCINAAAVARLASCAIAARLCYNAFGTDPVLVGREDARDALGLAPGERLVLQPTRAIPRKNVPAGLALAEALGATYWLTGPAEDGYGSQLDDVLRGARTLVVHRPIDDLAVGFAAADLVVMPSTLEGFGNPAVEAILHRRPVAVGPYAMADELRGLGLHFLDALDPSAVASALEVPDEAELESSLLAIRAHLDLADLPARLEAVLSEPRSPGTILAG
jgi:mannosylglucosylglycerate synthase